MSKTIVRLVIYSAIYGWSIGSVHSTTFASRNLVKFPLLMLITAAVCSLGYYIAARSLTVRLEFLEVQRLVLETFRDLSLLLVSLAPVFLFLAWTLEPPSWEGLGEYPLFLALNVLAIALSGSLALVRQATKLLGRYQLSRWRTGAIVMSWLGLTLLVGSQAAWVLRPFCGVRTVDAPFMLGTTPDYQGATDFYQALYHLVDPPPLADGYQRYLRSHEPR
jgi:hypothetical protein